MWLGHDAPMTDAPMTAHLTRRRLLRAAAVGGGLGALGLTRLGDSLVGAVEPELLAIEDPGSALARADRLGEVRPPIEPPPDGMLIFPLDPESDCYVLDNFGDGRGCCRTHEGVDIMGSRFQPVYAVADGVLTKRYTNTGTAGWGWTLYDEVADTHYKYFHCEEDANGFVEGDSVQLGDIIGYVGKSGTYGVDNYHLHFEVRPGNVPVDPLPLLVVDDSICGVSPPIR